MAVKQHSGKASSKKKNNSSPKQTASARMALIIGISIVAVLALIGMIIGLVVLLTPEKPDDRIIDNVYAGDINLGGMTQEEARNALHLATDNTYSVQDMVINLPDATLRLPPALTGAKLNVDAVVEEAFAYGRTGSEQEQEAVRQSAATTVRTIALLPYLDLNYKNIENTINEFCQSHSSIKTAPTVELQGERPTFDPNKPNRPVTHQTLVVTMGIPEYTLKAEPLYNLVLDYYSLHKLTLNYADHQALLAPNHSEPAHPNAQQIFNQYCTLAKDAVLDEITYEVPEGNKEIYGYGFDVAALQRLIDQADYGQVIRLQLNFLLPEVTEKDLLKDLFTDTLSTGIVSATLGSNWNNNLSLSCAAIDRYVIKPGEEFSFNLVVGQPTADKGYKKAPGYLDGKDADVMGSGVSQTASALYYCALKADLEILERHNHVYAPKFSNAGIASGGCLGLDAYVDGISCDLRFRNNTKTPIRILATAEGGVVTVELIGVNELTYVINLETEQVYVTYPNIIHQYVDKNNILGYKDGQILQTAIFGYGINSFKVKYSIETGSKLSRDAIIGSVYASRDQIVAEFPPTGPIDPDQPIDPDNPNIPIDPDDPNIPIDPDDPNIPIVIPPET